MNYSFQAKFAAHLQQTEAAAHAHGVQPPLRLFVEHDDVAKLPLEFLSENWVATFSRSIRVQFYQDISMFPLPSQQSTPS